jgi:DNA-directed RNA polymerase specialized sigma subunit
MKKWSETHPNSAARLVERDKKIMELRAANLSYTAIGKEVGITGTRVSQIIKRYERQEVSRGT